MGVKTVNVLYYMYNMSTRKCNMNISTDRTECTIANKTIHYAVNYK